MSQLALYFTGRISLFDLFLVQLIQKPSETNPSKFAEYGWLDAIFLKGYIRTRY